MTPKPPSLVDLGAWLAAANAACAEVDTDAPIARAAALRDLIAATEPRTLAEAAIVLGCAARIAGEIDRLEPEWKKIAQVQAMLFGVLPVIAEAAGVDPAHCGYDDVMAQGRAEFYGDPDPLVPKSW